MRRRRHLPPPPPRPLTDLERAWDRATKRTQESRDYQNNLQEQRRHRARALTTQHGPRKPRKRRTKPGTSSPIAAWANREWCRRWAREAGGKSATTWNTPWHSDPLTLYEGLSKHQATALMLLRTEVIGLNAWLESVGMPGVLPHCDCGWHAQTVKHVLLHCPKFDRQRPDLIRETQTENLHKILSNTASAQVAARWLVRLGILQQFRVAREIELEDTTNYTPIPTLER